MPLNKLITPEDISLVSKGLDLSVGLLTIIIIRFKWKSNGDMGKVVKDLIADVENKDREIERLQLRVHAAEMRHEHQANECRKKHLPRS